MVSVLIVVPANSTFDGQTGNEVIVELGETIQEDKNAGSNCFIVQSTIKDDLMVNARTVIITSTLTGDVWTLHREYNEQ